MIDRNNQLLFFTDPYPDELMYSVIARFHYYNCGLPYGSSQEKLFGSRRSIPNLYLAFYLDNLVSQLNGSYNSKELRDNHTIYPFIAPFLTSLQKQLLNKAIFKGKESQEALYFSNLINTYYYSNLKEIRYCPLCAKEDLERYGEVYLHRLNNLPGIDICPKHLCYLEKYPLVYPENSFRQYVYINPDRLTAKVIECCSQAETALAKSALEVCQTNGLKLSELLLRMDQLYRDFGYLKGQRLNARKLYEDLLSYYGKDYLAAKNCLLSSNQFEDYQRTYLYLHKEGYYKHFIPFKFLLIVNFLSGSFNNFMNTSCKKLDLQENGLCCYNPASNHYGQRVVKDFNIIDKRDYFEVIARCDCGMIYSARSDDLSKVKILQYGTVFYHKIQELIQQGLSLKEIGSRLNISVKTVRFIRDNNSNRIDDKIRHYRKRFLELKESNPELNSHYFRKHDSDLYYFLTRYDKDWFDEHSKFNLEQTRVNKETLDLELYHQTKIVINNLKAIFPPERITKRRILEEIGIEKFQLSQYPKTKELIDKEAESFLDYYLREIEPIVRRIIDEGLNISQKLLHDYGFHHSFKTVNGKAVWALIEEDTIDLK